MGNKKGAQTTTTSNTTASPEAMAAYRDILSRATTLADKPYEAYTGDRVAGFSPDQMAAFQATRDAQGIMSPYVAEATGFARTGASPIDAAAIARYQNPYQQSVIDATMADLTAQNAIAQQQVTGNAALRGALGGSRVGVAQALTAGEQARAQAPIMANLRASGYDKALAAAQQDRAAASSGASLMTGIGDAASTSAYRDIASLYGMGQQQQGNDQAKLDAAYQAYITQQAYPTQQVSWLTDIATRAGVPMGSSTTGTKTDPAPNPWNAILGAAGTVAGAAIGGPMGASIGGSLGSSLGGSMGGGSKTLADGGVVPSYAMGGVIPGYADGGYIDNDPSRPIDMTLDDSGSYSMPTTMAGMEGEGAPGSTGGFNWQSIGNPLMQAGLKMMSSTSPYLGVAIGEGGTAGMKAYADNAKSEAEKKHKEAQLKLQADRLRQSAAQHRETLDARREETRYTWGRDENNRLVRLPMRGDEEPRVVEGITMSPTGRGAAGRDSVFEQKRRAWLAINPADDSGALEFASGRRAMSEGEMGRVAILEAGREARAQMLEGKAYEDYVKRRAGELRGALSAAARPGPAVLPPVMPPVTLGAPAPLPGGAAPAAAPSAARSMVPPPRPADVPAVPGPLPPETGFGRFAPTMAPGISPKNPMPPAVRAEAVEAIRRGAPAAAIIRRLRERGYDPTGVE